MSPVQGKILGAVLLLSTVAQAAKMLHNPLRVRVNSELIKSVFHKQDQDLLKVVSDLSLGTYTFGDATLKDVQVSFEPLTGSADEFNYRLSLDQSKFVGIESDNMKIKGSGSVSHGGSEEQFSFDGPVSNFRVSFEISQGASEKKIAFKGIDLSLNADKFAISSSNPVFSQHGHTEQIRNWVQTRLIDELHNIKTNAFAGKDAVIAKLPFLSLAPAIGLYYAAFAADKMLFTDEFIEYEFSPVSMKLIKPSGLHDEFLKAIETEFAPQEPGESESALQLIVDENLINGVIGQFLKIDKMYSVRDLMSLDPRLNMMRQLLTTTTIGMVIPQFKEQYGEGRPLDVVLTPSHEFMTSGLGSVAATSFNLEANGNFNAIINIGAQIIVENRQGV